jgi:cytochrome d oxidase subunit CydB
MTAGAEQSSLFHDSVPRLLKYWLIAVNSLVKALLSSSIIFGLPFMVPPGTFTKVWISLYVARTDSERVRVLRSIGPVWDGNEVWLLAAGGTLYFAFPQLYASSFSGFYLPLMMVLWLLMLRGISIEFRSHVESSVWKPSGTACSAFRALFSPCSLEQLWVM